MTDVRTPTDQSYLGGLTAGAFEIFTVADDDPISPPTRGVHCNTDTTLAGEDYLGNAFTGLTLKAGAQYAMFLTKITAGADDVSCLR